MKPTPALSLALWTLVAIVGCKSDDAPTDDEVAGTTDDADANTGETAVGETNGTPQEVEGLELMTRLAGLWTGPATMTPLGEYTPMNMDLRPADDWTLFSRADLDADNSLRFAFLIETFGGANELVYRNGGYFQGVMRDSRTKLVEHTPNYWRFCSTNASSCDYIDARFTLEDDSHLVFDVFVQGQQHVYWVAERVETRPLPQPFPVDDHSQGMGEAPFPTMPTLAATVSWQDPLAEAADVWILLSTQDCPLMGFCDYSRSLMVTAEAGATSAQLHFDQIHPGSYKANAILDRDRNLTSTFFPGTGDAVSLPNQAVEIAAEGESTLDLFTIVEL